VTVPAQLTSAAALQEVKVRVAGVLGTVTAICPLGNVPRLVETEIVPWVLPSTVTDTVLVPLATTEAGLTVMVREAVGSELPLDGLEAPQPASSATAAAAERFRTRRVM
jgi:hypothetical protein